MTAGEQGHLNSLTPTPPQSGVLGCVHWGQRMGRVWEQPWLESEVRLGPRRAYPRVRLQGLLPADVSTPVWAERGTHICTPESVQTPSCGGKGPGEPPSPAQYPLGRNLRLGLAGEQAGRGSGEARGRQLEQAGRGPVSGWGQVSGWDKARLMGIMTRKLDEDQALDQLFLEL